MEPKNNILDPSTNEEPLVSVEKDDEQNNYLDDEKIRKPKGKKIKKMKSNYDR